MSLHPFAKKLIRLALTTFVTVLVTEVVKRRVAAKEKP